MDTVKKGNRIVSFIPFNKEAELTKRAPKVKIRRRTVLRPKSQLYIQTEVNGYKRS